MYIQPNQITPNANIHQTACPNCSIIVLHRLAHTFWKEPRHEKTLRMWKQRRSNCAVDQQYTEYKPSNFLIRNFKLLVTLCVCTARYVSHLVGNPEDLLFLASRLKYCFPDPRVDDWLLMRTPFPTAILFFLYLIVVWIGPAFMRDKRPFQIKWLLVIYNLGLVGLSFYMFYEVSVKSIFCCCFIFSLLNNMLNVYSPYTILWKRPFCMLSCSETPPAKCNRIRKVVNFENRLTKILRPK